MAQTLGKIPLINFEPFRTGKNKQAVADAIGAACAEYGFFCLEGHGVDGSLLKTQTQLSQQFFAEPLDEKMKISMERGGRAWRGYFPVGGELTSGYADLKEGLYFGSELPPGDARVQAGLPLHGANLFPPIAGFRENVLAYIAAQTELGHALMQAISLGLRLDENYFRTHFTSDPTVLYRIFHYPPASAESELKFPWGVGEHTDYGVLTLLAQDDRGGLEVKSRYGWIEVPPAKDVLVCNVGDMLDFMTGGYYLSAPHRVKNRSGFSRLSFPFFFDPSFSARMKRLPIAANQTRTVPQRWDQANLYQFDGTYGEYLLKKISKVFPDLAEKKL